MPIAELQAMLWMSAGPEWRRRQHRKANKLVHALHMGTHPLPRRVADSSEGSRRCVESAKGKGAPTASVHSHTLYAARRPRSPIASKKIHYRHQTVRILLFAARV